METRGLQIVKEIKSNIFIDESAPASEIVKLIWSQYQEGYSEDNSVNGAVFEEIIGYVLTIKNCTPFYMQARVAYVPNVNYDFILFDLEEGPVSISAKTTLRERWKQADLEAVALKYVHRNALSYLLTLDEGAVVTRRAKLRESMALNDFVLANTSAFDEMISMLQDRRLDLAGSVEVVTSNKVIDSAAGIARYELSR